MSRLSREQESRVTICSPEMQESSRTSMGIKWCFKCRGRHEFEWIVMSPTTEEGWYFGPTAHSECGGCQQQFGELFPGWSYRYD